MRGVNRLSHETHLVINKGLDRLLDVDTESEVRLEDFGLAARNRGWYRPSDWVAVYRAVRRLLPGPDDVFVDIGSGKGRCVLAAALLPMKRAIGVELSPELTAIAEANAARQRVIRRRAPVEFVTADATRYELPDDVTIVFFHSPFTGPMFQACMERVVESVDRAPRRLRLVYNYPLEHNYLLELGRFRPVEVMASSFPPGLGDSPHKIVVYETLGEPTDAPQGDPEQVGPWASFHRPGWLGPDFESASTTTPQPNP